MVSWPEKFTILRDNFKDVFAERVIRSNMDVGPAKLRRRTILGVSGVQFSMMLQPDVYEEFRTFYYDNDAGLFDFKRPDNGKVVQARFSSSPSASMNETMWLVSVQLEILP